MNAINEKWWIGVVFIAPLFVVPGMRSALGENRDGRKALVAMLDSRSRLISGHCTISGTTRNMKGLSEVSYEVYFDARIPSLRLTRRNGGAYIMDGKFQYASPPSGSEIRRVPLDELPKSMMMPINLRTLGFFSYPSQAVLYSEALDFGSMSDYFLTSRIVDVVREDDLQRLTLRIPKREGDHFSPTYRMWVAPRQGYSCVRWEQLHPSNKDRVVWFSEMSYGKRSGIWVVETFRQKILIGDSFEAVWKIEWHEVNGAVPASVFDFRNLVREGNRAVLFSIEAGTNRFVRIGVVDRPKPGDPVEQVPRSLYFNWAKAMYVSGIVLIIIAGLVVMGRKWRR